MEKYHMYKKTKEERGRKKKGKIKKFNVLLMK